MSSFTTATIDLSAILHNLKQVKELAPNSKVMAAIKADAYGHGLLEVASTLNEVDGFAVARLEEATQLREARIEQRILLLSSPLDEQGLETCSKHNIDITIHDLHSLELILSATLASPITVWIKFDSGMHRLGLNTEQFHQAIKKIDASKNIDSILLMTHFSSSDEKDPRTTKQQTELFFSAISSFSYPQSLANSAAIMQHPNTHKDWVRPGIMLYGANPLSNNHTDEITPILLPSMTLATHILAIRHIAKGESVGYNCRWTASKDSTIATLGIGYADGYPRHAKNGTPVLINNQLAPLVGTVSMDLISVDITNINSVKVGDKAILWGKGLPVETVAAHADTISYQLFTGVSRRVPRIYRR